MLNKFLIGWLQVWVYRNRLPLWMSQEYRTRKDRTEMERHHQEIGEKRDTDEISGWNLYVRIESLYRESMKVSTTQNIRLLVRTFGVWNEGKLESEYIVKSLWNLCTGQCGFVVIEMICIKKLERCNTLWKISFTCRKDFH